MLLSRITNSVRRLIGVSIFTALLNSQMAIASDDLPSIEVFYNTSNKDNLVEKVANFYDEGIKFTDPVGTIEGRKNLTDYLAQMYDNLISIHFDMHETQRQGNTVFATWTMKVRHKKLNSGDEIVVDGVSHINFIGGKAVYHRDYFDLGAMIYEHVPVLGGLTMWVKSKAAWPQN